MEEIRAIVNAEWSESSPSVMIYEAEIDGLPATRCVGHAWPGPGGKVRVTRAATWSNQIAHLTREVSEIEARQETEQATKDDIRNLEGIRHVLRDLRQHSSDDMPSDCTRIIEAEVAATYRRHFPDGMLAYDPANDSAVEAHFGVRDWTEW
jgi:hypothetical protein